MTSGIVYALLSAVAFGAYQLLNRKAVVVLGVTRGMTVLLATSLALTSVLVLLLGIEPEVRSASARGWMFFAAAGLFHFVAGFSFIALSQRSVGAGRTSSLVGTTPLFATLMGFLVLGEVVSWAALVGIGVIVVGVQHLSRPSDKKLIPRGNPMFGLAAAGSFSVSAVLIRSGLATGTGSLVGLWIGFMVAFAIYGTAFSVTRTHLAQPANAMQAYVIQVLAGLAMAFGMWFRYIAMNTVPVGVVTALGRVNIPLILIVSPWLLKTRLDAPNLAVWSGSLLIIGGATMIVFL